MYDESELHDASSTCTYGASSTWHRARRCAVIVHVARRSRLRSRADHCTFKFVYSVQTTVDATVCSCRWRCACAGVTEEWTITP